MYVFIAALAFGAAGCNSTPETLRADEYMQWVSSGDRTFNKVKEVKNIQLRARYLPADFLAYREYMSSDSIPYDSVLKTYQCGLSFQVTLQADKADRSYGNLQQYGVFNQEQLTGRIRQLSFGIENFIYAEHNGVTYLPVLSHYEGYDALGNRLSFLVVFIIPEYNCGKPTENFKPVTVTFDDPFWDIGKNNFEFTADAITDVPALRL